MRPGLARTVAGLSQVPRLEPAHVSSRLQARFTPSDLISRLRTFAAQTNHEFWPDDVSLRDGKLFTAERIHGSRQLTDLYLLALAGKHAGRLATFDQAISISAVCGAKVESLCVI
jgi:predicted nucleic acid-binding protein